MTQILCRFQLTFQKAYGAEKSLARKFIEESLEKKTQFVDSIFSRQNTQIILNHDDSNEFMYRLYGDSFSSHSFLPLLTGEPPLYTVSHHVRCLHATQIVSWENIPEKSNEKKLLL